MDLGCGYFRTVGLRSYPASLTSKSLIEVRQKVFQIAEPVSQLEKSEYVF